MYCWIFSGKTRINFFLIFLLFFPVLYKNIQMRSARSLKKLSCYIFKNFSYLKFIKMFKELFCTLLNLKNFFKNYRIFKNSHKYKYLFLEKMGIFFNISEVFSFMCKNLSFRKIYGIYIGILKNYIKILKNIFIKDILYFIRLWLLLKKFKVSKKMS